VEQLGEVVCLIAISEKVDNQQVLKTAHTQTKVTQNCYHQRRFMGSQCHTCVGSRGSTPDLAGGAYSPPPDTLSAHDAGKFQSQVTQVTIALLLVHKVMSYFLINYKLT